MYASMKGHEGCLRLLIAAGANVEHLDKVCECEWLLYFEGEGGWMKFVRESDTTFRWDKEKEEGMVL